MSETELNGWRELANQKKTTVFKLLSALEPKKLAAIYFTDEKLFNSLKNESVLHLHPEVENKPQYFFTEAEDKPIFVWGESEKSNSELAFGS